MSLGLSGGSQSSSSNSNVLSQGSTSGGSSRQLSDFQKSLQSPTFDLIKKFMTDPGSVVKPMIDQQKQQITNSYKSVPQTLRDTFMSTGGGKSGKYGTAALQAGLARTGDLAAADTAGAVAASQLPGQGAQLAAGLYGLNEGTNYSGTSTENRTGTSSGQGSQSGWNAGVGQGGGGLFGLG